MLAIATTKNHVFHIRSKHIELKHHFIQDLISNEEIGLKFINTSEQPIDILIKATSKEKLNKFKK